MKTLEKHTYGGDKASEVLADLLTKSENPKLIRRVGIILAEFSTICRELISSKVSKKE